MKSTPIHSRRRIRSIPALLATAWILMSWGATHLVAREETPEDAAVVRAVRVFGGSNETLPPVLLAQRRSPDVRPAYGEDRLTLEIDVQAPVPPAYSIRFVHCRADWSEDNNMFLSDIAFMQTSRIDWQLAPPGC
ncbi:MAG: hypothetical protein ACKOAX_07135, partial [Candidatus Kapaibacterium sp.]